jgi:endonuclease/exonuclease/phosphatase (EEP) superfamily protein YafD
MADADEPPMAPSPARRPIIRGMVTGWLAALTLVSALSFAGAWWVLDLLAHFHASYLLLAVLTAATLAALRWWRLALWAAALTAFEAALVLPLYTGAEDPEPAAPRLRVVSYNMLYGNPHAAEAAAHVVALEPDVVVLLEASAPQLQVFTNALPGWFVFAEPRQDPFSIAVLAREPPSYASVVTPGPRWMPAIELGLQLGDRAVTLLAVHPPPPMSEQHTRIRDELLYALPAWATAPEDTLLVVGDLNTTPWSSGLRTILAESPLRSTQSFGLQATWPAWLGPLGLPIDHVLYTAPLHPVARTIEPAFGSDHRMLFVELELR